MTLRLGDRARIDIPNELDPDFDLHGEHIIVLAVDSDRCSCGCEVLYEAALEERELVVDVHPWDLRPPI